jgi:hypothetical protein
MSILGSKGVETIESTKNAVTLQYPSAFMRVTTK